MCLDPVTATAATTYGVSRLVDRGDTTKTYNTGDTHKTFNTYHQTAAPTPESTQPVEPVQNEKTDDSLNIPKKKSTKTPNKQSLQTPKTINY